MFNNVWSINDLLLLFYVALVLNALPSTLSSANHNHQIQMSDDCRADDSDAAFFVCQLRTVDSTSSNGGGSGGGGLDSGSSFQDGNFNFTRLPAGTRHLRLECADDNFVENTLLNAGGFRQWTMLSTLEILYCKIGNLTHSAFTNMHRLRNLTMRTYNTDWSSMGLELAVNVFDSNAALVDLQRIDLSENNMWLLPAGVFCALHNLQ